NLPLPNPTTITNIPPQYRATSRFFPLHQQSLKYIKLTPPSHNHLHLLKKYLQQNSLFFHLHKQQPQYTHVIQIHLSTL
ncbi:aconitase family protein, partial [Staphylococcus pettenkoferi]|uniref:aconitase family protein n=1 Tax=Staphylococcus pettenkoferi TaxID=170573 RepID=UPI00119F9E1B